MGSVASDELSFLARCLCFTSVSPSIRCVLMCACACVCIYVYAFVLDGSVANPAVCTGFVCVRVCISVYGSRV